MLDKKLTIDDLEEVLQGNKEAPVEILPSGQIRLITDGPNYCARCAEAIVAESQDKAYRRGHTDGLRAAADAIQALTALDPTKGES